MRELENAKKIILMAGTLEVASSASCQFLQKRPHPLNPISDGYQQ
jgi:hypothetical protein